MLLVRGLGRYYDIISGGTAVFSPCKAEYLSRIGKLIFRTEVGVLQKGMAKRLTVRIENTGELEKQCALSYYTEPVLSYDRSTSNNGAQLIYRRGERAVFVRNNCNDGFHGEMAVGCDCDCLMTTDRERFLAGEVSGEVRPFPNSCAAVTAKVKLPPHSVKELRFTLCYSRADAEELCQDVFEQVCRSLERYDAAKASVSTWIFTITRNLLKNYYRDKKPFVSIDEMEGFDVPYEDDFDQAMRLEEIRHFLDEAMSDMDDLKIRMLKMRYQDEMKTREIALELGMSESNVRVTLSRTMKKLNLYAQGNDILQVL